MMIDYLKLHFFLKLLVLIIKYLFYFIIYLVDNLSSWNRSIFSNLTVKSTKYFLLHFIKKNYIVILLFLKTAFTSSVNLNSDSIIVKKMFTLFIWVFLNCWCWLYMDYFFIDRILHYTESTVSQVNCRLPSSCTIGCSLCVMCYWHVGL